MNRYMLVLMSTRLLDVGTLTPNPGVVGYMLLLKTTMLGLETLTPNPVQARFMLLSKIIWLEAVTTLLL